MGLKDRVTALGCRRNKKLKQSKTHQQYSQPVLIQSLNGYILQSDESEYRSGRSRNVYIGWQKVLAGWHGRVVGGDPRMKIHTAAK